MYYGHGDFLHSVTEISINNNLYEFSDKVVFLIESLVVNVIKPENKGHPKNVWFETSGLFPNGWGCAPRFSKP